MIANGHPNYKGVAAIHQHPYTCADLALTGVGHFHDWTPWPKDCLGVEPVCMWWGLSSIGKPLNPRCTVLLLWNEPQIPGQSDIDPVTGAGRWPEVEMRAAGLKFSTPCADSPWLNDWADAYRQRYGRWPSFDYVCTHSYPHLIPPRTVDDAIEQTKQEVREAKSWSLAHGGDGRVWLHEFALWPAWGSIEDTARYIEAIQPWLSARGVPRNWFALRDVGTYFAPAYDTSLVRDGQLTVLGEAYR